MPKYALGPVKPHLQAIADEVGTLFDVKVIGGWRPWSMTDRWEHPKGRAADFMTRDKAHGDAIAAHLVANADNYNVLYIIWWHRTWNPAQGWHPYTGTSNPHTDHVHLSVTEDQNIKLSGGVPLTFGPGDPLGNPVDDLLSRIPVLKQLEGLAATLADAGWWRRIGVASLGILILIIAAAFIRRIGMMT